MSVSYVACSSKPGETVKGTGTSKKEVMKLTIYAGNRVSMFASDATDVVTPYILKKFNLQLEFVPESTQSFEERLALWVSTNTLPDLFMGAGATDLVKNDVIMPLDEYIPSMTNFNKYWVGSDKLWARYTYNGKIYQIPEASPPAGPNDVKTDPYYVGGGSHAMYVREDILAATGYKFETLASIEARTTAKSIKPQPEDFAIDPPLDSPDAFYDFLRKVKDLNIEVDGKPIIPFSPVAWHLWHFGNIFGFGQWVIRDNGEVTFGLGSPGSRDYFKWIKKCYDEGLLDKDFLIHNDSEQMEKFASGRVASGVFISDREAANESLRQINPNATLRYIPWPKQATTKGFFDCDHYGFFGWSINKDFKQVPRLLEFWDWMYSDEGQDILCWGPAESGIWEMKDGKKVFVDDQVAYDVLNDVLESKGADYYGLIKWPPIGITYLSKGGNAGPGPCFRVPSPFHPMRSYPPQLNIYDVNKCYSCMNGVAWNDDAFYGNANTDAVGATGAYFWVDFLGNDIARLLTAKNDKEFDAVWDQVMAQFEETGRYSEAQADMKAWLIENGYMK